LPGVRQTIQPTATNYQMAWTMAYRTACQLVMAPSTHTHHISDNVAATCCQHTAVAWQAASGCWLDTCCKRVCCQHESGHMLSVCTYACEKEQAACGNKNAASTSRSIKSLKREQCSKSTRVRYSCPCAHCIIKHQEASTFCSCEICSPLNAQVSTIWFHTHNCAHTKKACIVCSVYSCCQEIKVAAAVGRLALHGYT
jgi:hypothetical protein